MSYKYNSRFSRTVLGKRDILWAGFIIVILLLTSITLIKNRYNPIPDQIKQNVKFVILYPDKTHSQPVISKSLKYDQSSKVFSFVYSTGTADITVAEQATPQAFTDIPQAYDKLVQNLNEYSSFDSYYGKVSLTKPKEFGNQQTAVFNSKGTLVFAHQTKGNWTKDQWNDLINHLNTIK